MKHPLKRILTSCALIILLVGLLSVSMICLAATATTEPTYRVEIVSFIRGSVTDLRCSELLEARIYKSEDNGTTWVAVTDVDGTSVSELTYTWTNTSPNTPMVVYLSHNMAEADLYGDTAEGTFKNGISSTAVGAQWAAYKTPGYDIGGMGGGFWPNFRPGGSSSSSSDIFSGTATVQVALPDGTVLTNSRSDFGQPNLAADLNNIALGLFVGDSTTYLDLLAESGIVHVNCTQCKVTNTQITGNPGILKEEQGKVIGAAKGETELTMTVSKAGCTVHHGQTAQVSTKAFVFEKPITSTTTTTLTLAEGSVDTTTCKYYINGVEGTPQANGSIVFSGLTPNTEYTVDVVASYSHTDDGKTVTRYAYAYVKDTTKPVYAATVNTYLNEIAMDINDIHGDEIALFIKTEGGEYIPLSHSKTGTYVAHVESGIYYVHHQENGGYHQINNNPLIVANTAASVDIHHYSVSYDAAGGAFQTGENPGNVNYASGQKVVVTNNVPVRDGYVFAGWSYGGKTYFAEDTVTNSISSPVILRAQWERKVNVRVDITIDHTYTDANGVTHTDINGDTKSDIDISLVARDDSSSAYLEVDGYDFTLSEDSNSTHTLYADGIQVNSYTGLNGNAVQETKYIDGDEAVFKNLSGAKEYFVTVAKAGYDASVTAEKAQNGDWLIHVSLKFDPKSQTLSFEVNMDPSVPSALYPKAAIVKILYFNTATNTWDVITQHSGTNPGVRVEIKNQTGNRGSYPVWVAESETGDIYGYRIMVSAFVYDNDTIVATKETSAKAVYTDNYYTATIGAVNDGTIYGNLKGAYFNNATQVGTLNASISLESYRVTFDAMGGKVNGNATQTLANQYFVPSFSNYTPVMAGHTFHGWWYQDSNGNYVRLGEEGSLLTEDITLYALWDQTLTGSLRLAGTYMLSGQEVAVWPSDRATEAFVVLQEMAADGLKTIDYKLVGIAWNGDLGTSEEYSFTGLDPIKQYRIDVLLVNYTAQYQNATTAVGSYNDNDYQAVFPASNRWETFVNGKLTFEPESYYQPIDVNASQISSGFRPQQVMVQVLYTERNTNNAYKIISQHEATGGLLIRLAADGKTDGLFGEYVWIENFNGHLYDYKLLVSDTNVTNLPVSFIYGPSASFDTISGQAKNALTVTLVPNKYSVTYDLNYKQNSNDTTNILHTSYEAHTWSFETEITYAPTREGYVFKGWSADSRVYENGKIKADVCEDVTLVAQWEAAPCDYTVEYYYDNVLGNTETRTAKYLDEINLTFDQKVTYDNKNYALDHVTGQPLKLDVDEAANVIRVYYATDILSDEDDSTNTPDGIPDKYQAVVDFRVVNGAWNNADDAKPRVYTLYQKTDGAWQMLTVPFDKATAPTATPDSAHSNSAGTWSPDLPDTVERSATYTLSFNDMNHYTVTVIVENGLANIAGDTQTFSNETITVEHDHSLSLEFAANPGFALDTIAIDGTVTRANGTDLNGWNSQPFTQIQGNHIIHVVYATDLVGGGTDGKTSDGIPDKYQKQLIFKVVNGTWDGTNAADIVKYVTLTSTNGWDETGSAAMPVVPSGMQANTGYKKGTWDVSSFPTTLTDTNTDTVTYTHTFKPIAYVDYVYFTEYYTQLPSGTYLLAEKIATTLTIELNADEDGFEHTQSAVNAVSKDFGSHYSENTTHNDRIASGVPTFGESLTLKLFYALDSHTVKYVLNGGNAVPGADYSDVTLLCGNTVSAQAAPHRTGYTFAGWRGDNGTVYAVNDAITVDQDITLTAQWEKLTGLSYIVHYLDEETGRAIHTEKLVSTMTFEDVVNSNSEVIAIDGYLFSYATPASITIGVDLNDNVINLYYTRDVVGGGSNGDSSDGIPDKFQKKLTFKVVNGTWDGIGAADIIKYVTLMTNSAWDENGTATVDTALIPTGMIANTGFKNGAWDVTFPVTVTATTNATYTYSFLRSTTPVEPSNEVKYLVEHYKANADGTYPTAATDTEILSGTIGTIVTATPKQYDGYCLNPLAAGTVASAKLVVIDSADDIVVLKLYYDADIVGGGSNGDSSDSIPDKFQKKLTFKVVNGTWDGIGAADIVKYVTLTADGAWSENGTATVDTALIPTGMIANTGFKNGSWDVAFPVTVTATTNATYTYSFLRSTTPVEPSNEVKYLVEHYKANADGTYPTAATDTEILSGTIGTTVTATPKQYDGYCLNPLAAGTVAGAKLVAIDSADDIVVLKLYYDADIVGGGSNGDSSNGDASDGIPDKFQKKLTFKVVNGTWSNAGTTDIIKYVTLTADGTWSENGTTTLDTTLVPTGMVAKKNFHNGTWNATFPITITAATNATYTYTFVAQQGDIIPPTGDVSQPTLLLAFMLVSLAGLCGVMLHDRKRVATKR